MITRVEPAYTTPAGYELNDRTKIELPLLADCQVGDELKLTPTGWRIRTAGEVANGIALEPGKAGRKGLGIGVIGEMGGFSGLTPGAPLYPDAANPGHLDHTVVAGFVPRVVAMSTTEIRYIYFGG